MWAESKQSHVCEGVLLVERITSQADDFTSGFAIWESNDCRDLLAGGGSLDGWVPAERCVRFLTSPLSCSGRCGRSMALKIDGVVSTYFQRTEDIYC